MIAYYRLRETVACNKRVTALAAGHQALQHWAAAALAAPRALAGAAELHLQHLERCLVVPCQLDGCAGQPAAQTTRRFARPAPEQLALHNHGGWVHPVRSRAHSFTPHREMAFKWPCCRMQAFLQLC